MNLNKLIFTENACYKASKKITVKGIMVHSTGANNPWLKRYVGPDDGKLGKNQYNNHWNTYHPGGREVCVHGFIGKLADGTVGTVQTLPIAVYSMTRKKVSPEINALSTILFIVILSVVLISNAVGERKEKKNRVH